MHIEKYNSKNKEEVENIFKLHWTDSEFLEELSNALKKSGDDFYVVLKSDEIVGVAGIRKINNFLKDYATTVHPVELYIIASKYKNRGIGHFLCDYVIKELKKLNYSEMVCYSPETHNSSWRFYEKLGFIQHGIVNDPDDGYPGMVWVLNIY